MAGSPRAPLRKPVPATNMSDKSRSEALNLSSAAARPPAHQDETKVHSIDGAVAVHISREAGAALTPLHQQDAEIRTVDKAVHHDVTDAPARIRDAIVVHVEGWIRCDRA